MNLSPVEAINLVNESVTVEMLVQRTKRCSGSRQVFLDSQANHRDPNNLGVLVGELSLSILLPCILDSLSPRVNLAEGPLFLSTRKHDGSPQCVSCASRPTRTAASSPLSAKRRSRSMNTRPRRDFVKCRAVRSRRRLLGGRDVRFALPVESRMA